MNQDIAAILTSAQVYLVFKQGVTPPAFLGSPASNFKIVSHDAEGIVVETTAGGYQQPKIFIPWASIAWIAEKMPY